jgi:hypothetical protein
MNEIRDKKQKEKNQIHIKTKVQISSQLETGNGTCNVLDNYEEFYRRGRTTKVFYKHFNSKIPENEPLVDEFSCAFLQKKYSFLIQGN